jgi:hypothetical protein
MSLLREFVQETLSEAAVSDVSDYALYVTNLGDNEINMLLYDYQEFFDYVNETKKLRMKNEFVRGMIKVRYDPGHGPCFNAWEVIAVKANKGFGPFMYDAAMALVPSKTLMPDRASVSHAAKNIWKYYRDNRKDVVPLKLDTASFDDQDSLDDCFSAHISDEDLFDYAYRMRGSGPNMRPAILKHERVMKLLGKKKLDGAFEKQLEKVLGTYF